MQTTTATRVHDLARGVGYDVAGRTRILTPALTPSIYRGERGKWDAVLVITRTSRSGQYEHRFGVGYVDATGKARRDFGGEVLPGPYAYAYGLAACIAADPRMSTAFEASSNRSAGTEHHVEDGDLLQLGGELFAVRYERDQWIHLDHVGSVL